MVIFTKKLGQLKQWTGEKFGSTGKTQKPTEIKRLQNETKSRFDGIEHIRECLNSYLKSLDDSKKSSLGELAQALSSQSHFHEDNEFGTLLITFGDGISKLSNHQNIFADEIRMGLLMSLDALLNETNQFEKLRKKLKNRRLDYDANNNKLQKCKKEDPFLEENVKSTKFKYEETLQKLEEMMITVNKKETELVDPFIDFMEMQISFYHDCLKTSESVLKVLKEGKKDLKSIDFVAASFRRELEDDDNNSWSSSSECSDDETLIQSKKFDYVSKLQSNQAKPRQIMVKSNYKFVAENCNEMSLSKGDIIEVTKKIDQGWWIGTCNGKSGMFPSNYVTQIDDTKDSSTDIATGAKMKIPNHSEKHHVLSGNKDKTINNSCSHCNCNEFNANFFKAGNCNNCFHKH